MASKIYIKLEVRRNFLSKIRIALFLFVIYSIIYLYWLPVIPLNDLILLSSDKIATSLSRNLITHGLGSIEDLPFLFRYWRNVTNYFLPILFYYYFISKKDTKHSSIFIFIFFIFVLYMQIFTTEKASALVFLIGTVLIKYFGDRYQELFYEKKKESFFGKTILILFIIVVFMFFYKLTMHVNSDLLKDIFLKIADQSSSNYLQIEYVREVGFLGFSGIYMPILSSLFNIELMVPSKYAIIQMYPAFVNGEIAGSAGGMSLTNLYYIIGWYSLPAFFLFATVFAFVDKVLINSIFNNCNSRSFYFNISFYTLSIMIFSRALGSNIWMVFSIPTVLSANIIIVLSFYFLFIKIPYKIYIKNKITI
ncbi:hypothetical protein RJ999_02065 [Aliarcobacter butzleri]|uniref:hypothetical protein n=1 Tax=Aliarcobacter butzleri TaxID=28197 RepID=UPI0028765E44|nr:hypothetical protein [Aliarcobacter butzleri]MDS1369875.1 hypothetical protein [Aliarcobacter butzleri]